MRKRQSVSDLFTRFSRALEKGLSEYRLGKEHLDNLTVETRRFLKKDLPNLFNKLYGRDSGANQFFWGKHQKNYARFVYLSEIEYDVSESDLNELISLCGELARISTKRQRELRDRETISEKIIPMRGFKIVLMDIPRDRAEMIFSFASKMLYKFYEEKELKEIVPQSIDRIIITANPNPSKRVDSEAFYIGSTKTIYLYDTLLENDYTLKDANAVMYALTHEIGHWVHLDYITQEAKELWDRPWQGVDTEHMDYRPYDYPQLQSLRVPTEYGLTNVKEDFAETFAWYVIDPSQLDQVARDRMKAVLTLSASGGKSFMKLAKRRAIQTMLYSDHLFVPRHLRNKI